MNWFLLALLYPAIFTVVNFIDKYVIEKKIKDYRGFPIYGSIIGMVVGTLFWIFSKFPVLGPRDAFLVIASGIVSCFASYFYYRTLSKNQTSIVIILFQMQPVIILILSYILLGASITLQQILGFILILSASITLFLKGRWERYKLSSAFYFILLADLLYSIAAILIKFTINANSFTKLIIYESWGIAIGGLLLYSFYINVRKAFNESFRMVGTRILGIVFLNEVMFVFAKAIQVLAITIGPVALVSILGSTQSFYGILYGILLTFFAPQIFKEDLRKESIIKKILISLIMLSGVYLIS